MAIPFPQTEVPRDLSGGADAWDDGLAGQILSADYFTVSQTQTQSYIKYWNGSAWVLKPLKKWNGSAWVPALLKRWNGASWVNV